MTERFDRADLYAMIYLNSQQYNVNQLEFSVKNQQANAMRRHQQFVNLADLKQRNIMFGLE